MAENLSEEVALAGLEGVEEGKVYVPREGMSCPPALLLEPGLPHSAISI